MRQKIIIALITLIILTGCSKETNGKILVIVPDYGFNLPELEIPLKEMKAEGYSFEFANRDGRYSNSLQNTSVKVDYKLSEVDSSDYISLTIIGGVGAEALFENMDLRNIVNEFNDQEKIISAQCLSGVILVESGVVKGKTITGWPTIKDHTEKSGVKFSDTKAAVSENIVTGRGCPAEGDTSNAVMEFTELYIKTLKSKLGV